MDVLALQNLIGKHVETTGSPRGQWVLENWLQMLPKFVKVYPNDYRRVVETQKRYKLKGLYNEGLDEPLPDDQPGD